MADKFDGCGILPIIGTRGTGKSWWYLKYLMESQNEFARVNELYGCDMVKDVMKITSCTVFEVEDYIKQGEKLKGDLTKLEEEISYLKFVYGDRKEKICYDDYNSFTLEWIDEEDNISTIKSLPQDRITQLKSQLKHCKNPLQRLNIERELNRLYKNKER